MCKIQECARLELIAIIVIQFKKKKKKKKKKYLIDDGCGWKKSIRCI